MEECRSRCAPTPAECFMLKKRHSESFDHLNVWHARLLARHADVCAQWDGEAGRTGDNWEWGRWGKQTEFRADYVGHVTGGSPGWLADRWAGLPAPHNHHHLAVCVCAPVSAASVAFKLFDFSALCVCLISRQSGSYSDVSADDAVQLLVGHLSLSFLWSEKVQADLKLMSSRVCMLLNVFSIDRLWQPFISSVRCCVVYSATHPTWLIVPWYLNGFSRYEAVKLRSVFYDCCSKTFIFRRTFFFNTTLALLSLCQLLSSTWGQKAMICTKCPSDLICSVNLVQYFSKLTDVLFGGAALLPTAFILACHVADATCMSQQFLPL